MMSKMEKAQTTTITMKHMKNNVVQLMVLQTMKTKNQNQEYLLHQIQILKDNKRREEMKLNKRGRWYAYERKQI